MNSLFGGAEFAAMSFAFQILTAIIQVAIFIPVVIYVVARWRTYKDGLGPDPHLGFKTAVAWFRVTSFQLFLTGLFMLIFGIQQEKRSQEDILRLAGGILLPAMMVWTLTFFAGQRTNRESAPTVDRMFDGMNLVSTGFSAFFGLIMAFVLLFQEHVPDVMSEFAWSWAIVYTIAWIALGVMFLGRMDVTGGRPPAYPVPAAPPPAAPLAPGYPPAGYPPPGAPPSAGPQG